MTILKGITWAHTRGYNPMVATAYEFKKLYPDIEIIWKKRSLQNFGNQSLTTLAREYDILVIDHPTIPEGVEAGSLVALDEVINVDKLSIIAAQSIGKTYESYTYKGHLWAIPIDAAAQTSAYRPDLLPQPPYEWRDVIRLAEKTHVKGKAQVGIPLLPGDTFSVFLSLCVNMGALPLFSPDIVVERSTGLKVLKLLRKLVQVIHPKSLELNPPGMLDLATSTDEIGFIPLIFNYSNYSRTENKKIIKFSSIPSSGLGPRGGVLGGAGLAISKKCDNIEAALNYSLYVASPDVQRGIYFESGGQPANSYAWFDKSVNKRSNDFFYDTWIAVESAYLRPRYYGFVEFRDRAAQIIYEFLGNTAIDEAITLERINDVYLQTERNRSSKR